MVNFRVLISLLLIALMGLGAFGGSTNAAPLSQEPITHETVNGLGSGTAVCNCSTQQVGGANIPHVSSTLVTLRDGQGTNAGSHGTGHTGTGFGGQTIDPGKCKYVQYSFACRKTSQDEWVCWVQSFSLAERDTTTADCPR